jgi:hypothetical protein
VRAAGDPSALRDLTNIRVLEERKVVRTDNVNGGRIAGAWRNVREVLRQLPGVWYTVPSISGRPQLDRAALDASRMGPDEWFEDCVVLIEGGANDVVLAEVLLRMGFAVLACPSDSNGRTLWQA